MSTDASLPGCIVLVSLLLLQEEEAPVMAMVLRTEVRRRKDGGGLACMPGRQRGHGVSTLPAPKQQVLFHRGSAFLYWTLYAVRTWLSNPIMRSMGALCRGRQQGRGTQCISLSDSQTGY